MKLKQLSIEDIEEVYYKYAEKDFPSEELKPLDMIKKLVKKEIYICYGLYEKSQLLAYAFLVTGKSYILIDYYAVCSGHRDKGIGSIFLKLLKEQFKTYDGMIVEVEKIEDAPNDAEKIIRKKRIDFYKRNGLKITKISIYLFNVNYSIMCLCNDNLKDLDIYKGLEKLYKKIVPEKLYLQYVKLILN
jgi:hypothetical protein